MLDKTSKFGKKIKKLEVELAKKLQIMEKKKDRLKILKKVNRRLKHKGKAKL